MEALGENREQCTTVLYSSPEIAAANILRTGQRVERS